MAFNLRLNEKQDDLLVSFMGKKEFATKSKAIIWLIENADYLLDSSSSLEDVKKVYGVYKASGQTLDDILS